MKYFSLRPQSAWPFAPTYRSLMKSRVLFQRMLLVAKESQKKKVGGQEQQAKRMILRDVAAFVHSQVWGWIRRIQNAVSNGERRNAKFVANESHHSAPHVEVDCTGFELWNCTVQQTKHNAQQCVWQRPHRPCQPKQAICPVTRISLHWLRFNSVGE